MCDFLKLEVSDFSDFLSLVVGRLQSFLTILKMSSMYLYNHFSFVHVLV